MAKKPVKKVTALAVRKGKKLYQSNPKKVVATLAAKHKTKLEVLKKEAEVLKLAKKGHTFEEISTILTERGNIGISPKEALELTKTAINKWCGEMALDARQAKELDIKRLDALLAILWEDIEPKPLLDDNGFNVLDAATGKPVMTKPDFVAIKLYKDILERRSRMLGFDADEAAVKVVVENNIIERRYVGGSPDDL
jgi:hypothetical protein